MKDARRCRCRFQAAVRRLVGRASDRPAASHYLMLFIRLFSGRAPSSVLIATFDLIESENFQLRRRVIELWPCSGFTKTANMRFCAPGFSRLPNPMARFVKRNVPGTSGTRSKCDLEGAVRVSGNWRLTFAFESQDAILVDCHRIADVKSTTSLPVL